MIRATRLPFYLLLLAVTACGFHLRGAQLDSLRGERIYLQSARANALLAEVRTQLANSGIDTAGTPEQGRYHLLLKNEQVQRSILSISPVTGKVEEFQLTLSATIAILQPGAKPLLSEEKISLQRDYFFDEGAILGKFSEELQLEQDLREQAANQIIRRLNAILKQ